MAVRKTAIVLLSSIILLSSTPWSAAIAVPSSNEAQNNVQAPSAPASGFQSAPSTSANGLPDVGSIESTPSIAPEILAKRERAKKVRQKIEDLGKEIGEIVEEYNGASLEASRTATSIEKTRKKIYAFEYELQAQRREVNEKVVQIYKQGSSNPIELIVNATSFPNFIAKFGLMMKIAESYNELVQRVRSQKLKIEEARYELRRTQKDQKKKMRILGKRKAAVLERMKDYQNFLKNIDEETRVLLDEQFAKDKNEQALLKGRFQASSEGSTVVSIAMQYLGLPYVWGGESPEIGFDCSGLTRFVYLHFGVDMPHWVPSQWEMGVPVAEGDEAPGDLVFFNNLNHVGIYIGDGYFIQAPRTGDYIKITALSSRTDYMGARRFIVEVPGS